MPRLSSDTSDDRYVLAGRGFYKDPYLKVSRMTNEQRLPVYPPDVL